MVLSLDTLLESSRWSPHQIERYIQRKINGNNRPGLKKSLVGRKPQPPHFFYAFSVLTGSTGFGSSVKCNPRTLQRRSIWSESESENQLLPL